MLFRSDEYLVQNLINYKAELAKKVEESAAEMKEEGFPSDF